VPVVGFGGEMALRTAVTLGNKQFLRSIDQMERRMGGFTSFMHRHSLKFAAGAGAITAGLGLAAKAAADFEQSMANMDSVANTTGAEFGRLRQLAFDMSETTTRSATESATAMYELASAGQRAGQIYQTLPSVIKLADATQFDLSQTTSTVVSTLKAFGLEADQTDRLVNVMAATIGNSLAKMDKLSASYAYVGTVASKAGLSIESTSAALAVLYDAGLDGSQAGTTLRRILAALLKPTESLKKRIRALGLDMMAIDPRMHSLSEIMQTLNESGMDATAAFEDFGLRGAPGLLALLQAGDGIDEFEQGITGTNRAAEMLARQMDTLQAQGKILKNQIVTLGIKIGEKLLPYVKDLVEWLKGAVSKVGNMSDAAFELTAKLGLTAGAVLGLLAAVGRAAPILGAATGPVGALVIAVGALVTAYHLADKAMDDYHDALRRGAVEEAAALETKTQFAAMLKAAFSSEYWEAVGGDIMNFLIRISAAFGAFFDDVGEDAKMLGEAFNPKNWLEPGFWSSFAAELDPSETIEQVKAAWENAPVDLPEGGTSWARDFYDKLFTPPPDVIHKAGAGVGEALAAAVTGGDELKVPTARLRGFAGEMSSFFTQALEEGLTQEETIAAWQDLWGPIGESTQAGAEAVEARVAEMSARIRDEMEFAAGALTGFMQSVGADMADAVLEEKKFAKEMVKSVIKAYADLVEKFAQKAVTNTLMAQAETAGILSMQGLYDLSAWAKLAPAMAKGAATIALIKAIKGKLGFHSGGAPYGEGWKWVKNDEIIMDRSTAQRGGYGRATMDAAGQSVDAGARVTVSVNIAQATLRDETAAHNIGRIIGEEIEFALDGGA